ncbi:hypothetical protein PC9H_002165 [Pleurotus ostreatus]|uniref:Uncharacterized protein n=1 Tax=Pleurotus ostreatus TaxID=5322 RepID=A0A8H6ZKT7_PLEOS|nr:uncharacterized protein PC9H_002165 [Pleurotus ostreatus]KAF7419574.1 hypothetical protein PC9H_002165 [Pleurotus ostreatus]
MTLTSAFSSPSLRVPLPTRSVPPDLPPAVSTPYTRTDGVGSIVEVTVTLPPLTSSGPDDAISRTVTATQSQDSVNVNNVVEVTVTTPNFSNLISRTVSALMLPPRKLWIKSHNQRMHQKAVPGVPQEKQSLDSV